MSEFDKLVELLDNSDILHNVYRLTAFGGKQVVVYYNNGDFMDDAIMSNVSHGGLQGLLETFLLNNCKGFETAEEVFSGWKNLLENSLQTK